ncbi:hypothetical protein AB00_3412 [Raoultella ornithinolytica 2-156-04_S1_C1]|nr:hypothetical protein AB00_3412 [Raoultella ornithinolytica 2-156-04_S1_C1]
MTRIFFAYSMLTIPPLKNLLQGYRNVTATGRERRCASRTGLQGKNTRSVFEQR